MAAAPPGNTGAEGITFEDRVVASYLCALLRGDSALGLDHHVVHRVGVQQRYAGHLLDDMVVNARRGTSPMTLSLEIKKKLDVNAAVSNRDFREIVHRAYQTVQNNNTFQRGIDRVGVVTGDVSKAQRNALDKLCRWAKKDGDVDRFFKRFRRGVANATDRAVVEAIQELLKELGVDVRNGVHDLLRHFVLIEVDFGVEASESELLAVSLLRSILINPDEAPKLWATLRALVRDGARDAAQYDREGLLYRVNLDFRLKEDVVATAPLVMNMGVLRLKGAPLGLSPVYLSEDLWGDYAYGLDPHTSIGQLAQVARSLPELSEDIKQLEIVAPVGSKDWSIYNGQLFDRSYFGLCEISFNGELYVSANRTVTLEALTDRPVQDAAWQRLVHDRVPESVFSPSLPLTILTISISFGGVTPRHVAPGRESVIPVTVSYRLDVSRVDAEIAQSGFGGVTGLTLLAAADALRSYVAEDSHEIELPIQLFGAPSGRTLKLRFAALNPDSEELKPFRQLGGARVQSLIQRWMRIQDAVRREVNRRLMVARSDGS